jgi:hypothetical protein
MIELAYGRRIIEFSFDEHQFCVLSTNTDRESPLSDFEIGAALDSRIASPPLDEIVDADDSVLIVVSDATRDSERAGRKPAGAPSCSGGCFTGTDGGNLCYWNSSTGQRKRKD